MEKERFIVGRKGSLCEASSIFRFFIYYNISRTTLGQAI